MSLFISWTIFVGGVTNFQLVLKWTHRTRRRGKERQGEDSCVGGVMIDGFTLGGFERGVMYCVAVVL